MLAKIHDRIKEQAKVKQADKWIRNPKEYIEDKLYIRTKDKQVIPLRFNPIQEMYWGEKSKRDIILKPRQLGFSTLTVGRFFECVINEENVTAVIIADADSTQKMFQMVQLMYEWLPEAKKEQLNNGKNKPKYGNRKGRRTTKKEHVSFSNHIFRLANYMIKLLPWIAPVPLAVDFVR